MTFVNSFVANVLLLLTTLCCSALAADKTACLPVTSEEHTHWTGNEEIILREDRPHRAMRGVVVIFPGRDHPLKGALVEVFTRPEYLMELTRTAHPSPVDGRIDSRGREYQQRVAACRTTANGRFAFDGVPDGTYELRVSSDDTDTGWNVTQMIVVINRRGTRKDIVAQMMLAT